MRQLLVSHLPCVTCISECLWEGHWLPFALDYLFKHVCIVNSFGRQCYLPEQKAGMPIIKDSGSLNSGFLSCSTTSGVCAGVTWFSLCPLWGRGLGKWCKKMLIFWFLPLLWVINCSLSLTHSLESSTSFHKTVAGQLVSLQVGQNLRV